MGFALLFVRAVLKFLVDKTGVGGVAGRGNKTVLG